MCNLIKKKKNVLQIQWDINNLRVELNSERQRKQLTLTVSKLNSDDTFFMKPSFSCLLFFLLVVIFRKLNGH